MKRSRTGVGADGRAAFPARSRAPSDTPYVPSGLPRPYQSSFPRMRGGLSTDALAVDEQQRRCALRD